MEVKELRVDPAQSAAEIEEYIHSHKTPTTITHE